MATPMSTSPFMMAAILNISPAALHVDDSAPPPFFFFCTDCLRELTIVANDCSVLLDMPRDETPVCALSPPKAFMPSTYAAPDFLLAAAWLATEAEMTVVGIAAIAAFRGSLQCKGESSNLRVNCTGVEHGLDQLPGVYCFVCCLVEE